MRRLLLLAALLGAAPAHAQLSGTYEIGPVSGTDFDSIAEAVDVLNAEGISGPVRFLVHDAVYDKAATLKEIVRYGDPDDPVVFGLEEEGDRATWRNSSASASENWILLIAGATNVRFVGFDFEATEPTDTYGRLVVFDGTATDIAFDDCRFRGFLGGPTDATSLLFAEPDADVSGLSITDSELTHGYFGLDAYSWVPYPSGLTLTDNAFVGQTLGGVRARISYAEVRGNEVSNGIWASASYVALDVMAGGSTITGNEIRMIDGAVGIRVNLSSANEGQRLVANNLVGIRAGSGQVGIDVGYGDTDVVHNTVWVNAANAVALRTPATSGNAWEDVVLRNNVLVHGTGGTALEVPVGANVDASDHNAFYNGGSTGDPLFDYEGTTFGTLAFYQAASGLDANSVSVPVTFASTSPVPDVHLAGASLTDIALIAEPFGGIPTDADGQARDPYNPKMGADEGTPLPPFDNADQPGGFYAVAGSSPDFATPQAAFDALEARGMKGATTLRIRAGTFPLSTTLSNTLRVGPAAADPASTRLLIRGANTNNRPTITTTASSAADNYIFHLDGIDNVGLLTFNLDATAGGAFGTVLRLGSGTDGQGTDDLDVTDCTLEGEMTTATGLDRSLVLATTRGHDGGRYIGSRFLGGSNALRFVHGGGENDDVGIADNTFTGQSQTGVYGPLARGQVNFNTFASAAPNAIAIQLTYREGYSVFANQIGLTGANSRGLWLVGQVGTAADPGHVANNMIRAAEPVVLRYGATGARILHNTLSAPDAPPLTLSGAGGSASGEVLEAFNNVYHRDTGTIGVYIAENGSLVASGSNLFSVPGGTAYVEYAGTIVAVENVEATTGVEVGSREKALAFVDLAAGDLHLDPAFDQDPEMAGISGLASVLIDLDYEARQPDNPYIGADELSPLLPLAGTYSVYANPLAASAAPADFATLAEAARVLTLLGVGDEVTLALAPGEYLDRAHFGEVDGTTASTGVLVTPVEGPGSTRLTSKATTGAENHVVQFDGTDHVTIEGLELDGSGGSNGYGRVLLLVGEADGITVREAELRGLDGGTGNGAHVVQVLGAASDLTLDDVHVIDGSAGLWIEGAFFGPAFEASDVTVTDATFSDQTGAGIYARDVSTLTTDRVEASSAAGPYDGVSLRGVTGATLTGLEVHAPNADATGLEVAESTGVHVVNTTLNAGGRGLSAVQSGAVVLLHTTVRADGTAEPAVYLQDPLPNTALRNVILAQAGDEPAVAVVNGGSNVGLDFAAFDVAGGVLAEWNGTDYTTVAGLEAGTGQGSQSVATPVAFVNGPGGNLRLTGASDGDPDLIGLFSGIATDIDGDPRSTAYPYMGADEAPTPLEPMEPSTSIVVDGERGIRFFGPPAEGVTVDDLAAQNLVRGVPGYYASNPNPNLWTAYDPVGGQFVPSTGTGEILELGRAFAWYMLDQDGPGDPTISRSVELPFTLSTDLEPNTDDLLLELNTDGNRFNFLANPFPYPLLLDGASSWPGGAGIRSALYAYDHVDAAWELAPIEIGPWEAFRFRAAGPRRNGNPRLLIIPASAASATGARTAAAEAGLEASASDRPVEALERPVEARIAFALEARAADGRPLGDRMLTVAFGDSASAAFSADEDVEKFQPPATAYALIGARVGGEVLGHDARPFAPTQIPLALEARGAASAFTLSWDASALLAGLPVTLVDLATGLEVDVRGRSSVAFEAASRPALDAVPTRDLADGAAAVDRFVLRIGDALANSEAPPEALGLEAPRPNPTAGSARVGFAVPEAGAVRLAVYDVRGREVAVLADGRVEAGRHEAALEASRLAAGVYVVRLEAGGGVLTRRATVVR